MVEDTHHSGDSNIFTKSVGSSIKINSISIDLVSSNDTIDIKNCEHFSIRGYVSEVRKRDWKRCWPFALNGNHDNSDGQTSNLPPLTVPKFRWWQCQNCHQEITADGTASDIDVQEAQSPNTIEERNKVDSNAPAVLHRSCCHPSSCSDKKERKAEPAKIPVTGHKIATEENSNGEIPMLTDAAAEVASSSMQERNYISDRVFLEANCNGSDDSHKAGSECLEVTAIECADRNLKRMVRNSTETCKKGKENSLNDQNANLIALGSYEVAGMVDEASDMVQGHTSEHPSLELDECDNTSTRSTDVLVRSRFQHNHQDNPGGVHRKKTRKVRLLTELLGKNGGADTSNLRKEDHSPSNALTNASRGLDVLSDSQSQMSSQRNNLSGVVQNRKKKLSQDDDWTPQERSPRSNAYKRVKSSNADAETTSAAGSSDFEDNSFLGIGLQAGTKNHLSTNNGVDVPFVKKKNEKSQSVNENFPLVLYEESLQNDVQKKTDDLRAGNATDSVSVKSVSTTFAGRGLVPCPLHAQNMERRYNSSKKKNKMHQVDEGQASTVLWNNDILRESHITSRGVGIMQSKPTAVPCQSALGVSTMKGLDLSLNSFLASQQYDKQYFPHVRDAMDSPLSRREASCKEDQATRKDLKTNSLLDLSFFKKSEPLGCLHKGVHFNLSGKGTTSVMPFLNEKQKFTPAVELGDCSIVQQMDTCGGSSNKKTVEIQENSTVSRKHIDPRADKVPEQVVLDDIPMEIVELMAKNQYERCLPDTEDGRYPLQVTNSSRNLQRMDRNKVYGNAKLNLLQEETAIKPKPRAKNGRVNEMTRGKNVLTANQKSVDCFSHTNQNYYNISQLGQPYAPGWFNTYPQYREKPSSAIQFSGSSSGGQSSSHNCQWVANMIGQRSPRTTFRELGTCNTCQSAAQQCKEPAHLWSSVMPNQMPFAYGMTHNGVEQPTKMNLLSCHPSNLLKGNINGNHDSDFLNLNISNHDKQNQKFNSETLCRTHPDYSYTSKHNGVGSLDLYSNETIPAMHLLSLMDAGLQSGRQIDLNGSPKFVKRPSFPHDRRPVEFSGLPSGGCKASNIMKYPSFNSHSKSPLSENSREKFSAVPIVGASAFSFQPDKSFKKASDCTAQVPSKFRDKEKIKESGFLSGNLHTDVGSVPVPSMPKFSMGISDSAVLPLKFYAMKTVTRDKSGLQNNHGSGTVWPLKNNPELEVCSINRNPADFTIPEAGNVYMIKGQDLKLRKQPGSGSRSGFSKAEGTKRRKKHMPTKEHP